jgi:hypothetical protein
MTTPDAIFAQKSLDDALCAPNQALTRPVSNRDQPPTRSSHPESREYRIHIYSKAGSPWRRKSCSGDDTSVTFTGRISEGIISPMATQARLRTALQPGAKSPQERAVFRRWQRYRLNLPIRLIFNNDGKTKIMAGRGNDMSEGGVLVFAGMELKTGDEVQIEFTPPFSAGPVRAKGVVRHRRGYNYGIEFLLENDADREQTEKFRSLLRLAAGSDNQ